MPNPVAGVAAIKAGGSLISGSKAASAAKKAAAAQEAAQREALALQREMFERQVALQDPFRQAGIVSQNELLRQMGLGGDACQPVLQGKRTAPVAYPCQRSVQVAGGKRCGR